MTSPMADVEPELACVRVVGDVRALAPLLLTRGEREYCAALRNGDRYAGRVAVKHAVARLIGSTAASPIALADIVVTRRVDGRPVVQLRGDALDRARTRCIDARVIEVSITHRAGDAVAIAAVQVPSTDGPEFTVGVDVVDSRVVAHSEDRIVARLAGLVLTRGERSCVPFARSPRATTITGIMVKEAAGKVLKRDCPGISWHDVTVAPLPEGTVPAALARLATVFETELRLEGISIGQVVATPGYRSRVVWATWGHRGAFGYAAALGASGP